MLADSHRYRISTKKFIKIGQAVSEEYGNENCDTRILYNKYSDSLLCTMELKSYQEHNCAILGGTDVMFTDIVGSSIMSKVKRAWFDLFLVSQSDERSRTLFSSSHALSTERFRQYRKYRCQIHPYSKFRSFWDFLILHAVLLRFISININTSMFYGDMREFTYYLAAVAELVVMADVGVNMLTGVVDEGPRRVVFDRRSVLLRYCSTKLFFHVSSAIPLQWIMFLRYGFDINCSLCKFNRFTKALKVLNAIGLVRLFECSTYWSRERKSLKTTFFFKFLRIVVLCLLTVSEFNELADLALLAILISTGRIEDYPYPLKLIILKYVIPDTPQNFSTKFFIYNINRSLKAFCLYSLRYMEWPNFQRMVILLLKYFIANLFFWWKMIELIALLERLGYGNQYVLDHKQMALNNLRHYQVPDQFAGKVERYFDLNTARFNVINPNNGLWKVLPPALKQEIALINNGCYLKHIPFFDQWPPGLMDQIVQVLKELIFLNMDLVVQPQMNGDGLYIVQYGELAVYTNSEEKGHLIDGDYFGEVSLVTDREIRTSSVVAITDVVLLFLSKIKFRMIMRDYPELFLKLKLQLKTKYMRTENKEVKGEDKK